MSVLYDVDGSGQERLAASAMQRMSSGQSCVLPSMLSGPARQRLPSLTALRAFEAAARHLNLTRAAEELCVSQSAISHQIRNLESDLKTKLLVRSSRTIALTKSGHTLATSLAAAFQQIALACEKVNHSSTKPYVVVAPTIAIRVVLPGLMEFSDLMNSRNIQMTCAHGSSTLEEGFDVGILYGHGSSWPNAHVELIMAERLAPLCTADYKRKLRIRSASDLGRATLLHGSGDRRDWRIWADAAHVALDNLEDGPTFETLDVAFRAASSGFGILVGDIAILQAQPYPSNLVPVIDLEVLSGRGHFLVCRRERLADPDTQEFLLLVRRLFSTLQGEATQCGSRSTPNIADDKPYDYECR